MAVLLAQVGDVRASRFEDPQPKQTQQAQQREIELIARQPGGAQHRFELQVTQPEGR